jgi:acyl-CoA synthetase (AMP-forming)/AMP-acid ligase II
MLSGTECAHVGLMTKLPTYLRTGATVFVLDRWRAADVLRLVHTHRMAVVGGVAPQVALMLRQPDFDTFDLSCVQALIVGGSASSPALVREARERFGAPYSIRYSSTESGGIGLGTAFDADDDEAFHSVGRPRGDTEVTVRDGEGRPVPEGEVGELWLRSSTMLRGYWRNPEATAEAIVDGWLRTGDLASIGADGLVRLAGRAKEMYIRGGYNVYPVEVEGVLASHPGVADVVVVPRPDPVMGELGVAVVVPADPASPPSLDELRAHGAERLAPYKLPEALRIVDQIPLTGMHKQDRRALAAHEARSSGP